MKGEALPAGEAFTQYLSGDSVFAPIRRGTVGVIDGRNQYVVNLESGHGVLHSLAEAWRSDIDHSTADPELAARLRQTIRRRFPELRL